MSEKKPLPDFDEMWAYFPTGESEEVKKTVGGGIDSEDITNTCVIRVSRCLNYAGAAIPGALKDLKTRRGKDKKHYALRVKEFKKYMQETYGDPTLRHANKGDGGPVPDEFKVRRGVIMFDVRVWSDATGHFTLWNGKTCADKCYFDKAREVWLWAEARKAASITVPTGTKTALVMKLSGEVIHVENRTS